MAEHEDWASRGVDEQRERAAELASGKKVPERVALWRSIISSSMLSNGTKDRMFSQLDVLLSVTTREGGSVVRSGFSTVRERLEMLRIQLQNICLESMRTDDEKEVATVYQNVSSDITALAAELYGS